MQISSLLEKNLPGDNNIEVFVVHVTFLSFNFMLIHPAQKARIVLLVIKKVQILFKYSDFLNVFLEKKALVLLVATNLNKHVIKNQKRR